ncbi:MAG: hypothetical protein JO025_03155 [Verrucomicrobia bacterium]|nr:hypothetical protein [Verrucomicrobiota bacterium]
MQGVLDYRDGEKLGATVWMLTDLNAALVTIEDRSGSEELVNRGNAALNTRFRFLKNVVVQAEIDVRSGARDGHPIMQRLG